MVLQLRLMTVRNRLGPRHRSGAVGHAWQIRRVIHQHLECAPAGGQIRRFELTPSVGLPENGSHDKTPIPQRCV